MKELVLEWPEFKADARIYRWPPITRVHEPSLCSPSEETSMTESERIVLKWKHILRNLDWPEEQIQTIVQALCEAGYRRCIEDIQARQRRDDDLIKAAIN